MTRLPYMFMGAGILLALGFAYFFSAQNVMPRNTHRFISGVPSDIGTATVKYVIDGDTIVLTDGAHVRYIGMNAPEIAHLEYSSTSTDQCYGPEAKTENEKLLNGKTVWLEPDKENTDKYGRLLRYVWVGETMIDLELVREGYARKLVIAPNMKYAAQFKIAEASARAAKLGWWGVCVTR